MNAHLAVRANDATDGTSGDIFEENREVFGSLLHACQTPKPRVSSCPSLSLRPRLTEVQHDVGMVQVLEQLDLGLETLYHALGPRIVLVVLTFRQLNLLDRDSFPCVDAEADIHVTESTAADEISFDPFVRD